MSELKVLDKDHIRLRRERLISYMYGGQGTLRDLAKELGVTEKEIYNDWSRRDSWLDEFLDLRNVRQLSFDVVLGVLDGLQKCRVMVDKYDAEGAKSAANGAMKNFLNGYAMLSTLLQTMGSLPKVAIQYEVDQKIESVEVKASESDIDYLNKAANILNKAGGSQKRPENLH
jgi:hypothetical protein